MAIKYKKKWIVREKDRWGTDSYGKRVKMNPDVKEYITSLTEDGHWMCSCPQWKFRRITCKHITMVQHKYKYANYRNWDHPSLDDYEFEEIDPAITGSLADIARTIGKTDE